MARLTAVRVRSIDKPGRYGDGNGLYLNVAKGGSKSWVQRITIDGVRRDMGLGGYPVVSLVQARAQAAENRSAVASGATPSWDSRRRSPCQVRPAVRPGLSGCPHGWLSGSARSLLEQRHLSGGESTHDHVRADIIYLADPGAPAIDDNRLPTGGLEHRLLLRQCSRLRLFLRLHQHRVHLCRLRHLLPLKGNYNRCPGVWS